MQDKIIRKHILFEGLSDDDYKYALKFFNAKELQFNKDETLNTVSDVMNFFGLVTEGTVQVYMNDFDGNQIIMATNEPGDCFGESLCFLGAEAPVQIVATSMGSFLKMNSRSFNIPSDNPLDIELKRRFTSILAKKNLHMNYRIQILSKISIREKLVTFFAECKQQYGGTEFTVPFDRNDMAIYLGVNRSALSRELSLMQSEGMIKFHKNKFSILKV